jgi:hypothetical protein
LHPADFSSPSVGLLVVDPVLGLICNRPLDLGADRFYLFFLLLKPFSRLAGCVLVAMQLGPFGDRPLDLLV